MTLTSSCSQWNQNLFDLVNPKRTPVSEFCSSYHKVIREAGDGSITAKLAVKQRIAANEIYYKCQCEKIETYCKIGSQA